MRSIYPGLVLTFIAGAASAQGHWQPQASPAPAPPSPVYVSPPPPAPRPPSGKERQAMPLGSPSSWMTPDDYPSRSLRQGDQGTTSFRVTVGPDGMVTGCAITLSSGFAELDETACSLVMRRGRFSPALDRKGKPTTGTWSNRFKWVLPGPPRLPAPFSDSLSFIVERDGSVSNCTGTGKYADLAGVNGPCNAGVLFQPYLDPAGNPVRRHISMTAKVEVTDPDAPPPVVAPAVKPPVQPRRRKQP